MTVRLLTPPKGERGIPVASGPASPWEALADDIAARVEARLAPMLTGGAPAVPEPLVSKQVLAARFTISTAKVDRMTREGTIPFVVVGESRRYDVADVRAALEARQAASLKVPEPKVESGVRRVTRGSR